MANMGLLRPFRWISGFIVETENLRRDKYSQQMYVGIYSRTPYII